MMAVQRAASAVRWSRLVSCRFAETPVYDRKRIAGAHPLDQRLVVLQI
jgi:hypothetical protein